MSPHEVMVDSKPLMRAIAKLAGMEHAGCKRMVLVLDIHAVPMLYVDSLVRTEASAPIDLPDTPIVVVEEKLPLGAASAEIGPAAYKDFRCGPAGS